MKMWVEGTIRDIVKEPGLVTQGFYNPEPQRDEKKKHLSEPRRREWYRGSNLEREQ